MYLGAKEYPIYDITTHYVPVTWPTGCRYGPYRLLTKWEVRLSTQTGQKVGASSRTARSYQMKCHGVRSLLAQDVPEKYAVDLEPNLMGTLNH